METLNADKPLDSKDADKFNRYPFAKRIADTIKSRKESECLVIGIYGAWGEGKTTVLNFIGI
jgi:predicted KAP-like P-loop ATPase